MSFETLFGTAPEVTIGLTLVVLGGCALLTGRALAANWNPTWHVVPYVLLLGLGDRFLGFALFGGELLSPGGFLLDTLLLLIIALLAYRWTRARRMVRQYPWLFRRAGPFHWRRL